MKEYLSMKDAFWCKIKFGNYGVRCFIEDSYQDSRREPMGNRA